jgi:ABC-2 type transport system ATP-binding protein
MNPHEAFAASDVDRAFTPPAFREEHSMSFALTISGLSKTYPNGVHALSDVSLTIPTGMFGLLGPNGAGKSTLMRTLATLQEADAGTVTMGEVDVLRDKAAVRGTLGYLPQDFGVYPKVSAEELLDHLARLKGLADRRQRREAVASLLRQTNLYDVRKKALGGFSGGMRQRFGIAQALLCNPRLVVVDEPTAGLDPEERVRFHNLLAEIGENVIVILSTHIVSDVSDLCARMAIINKGRVLLTGRPLELTQRLEGRVWQKAIARGDLDSEKAAHPVISTRLLAGRTLINVVSDAAPGEGFTAVDATLEDVYFAAIAGRLDTPADALQPA